MNKSKGNMYPWVTHTWNPIKGICPHQCSYLFQSKNLFRFKEFLKLTLYGYPYFPPKTILGTTIETNRENDTSILFMIPYSLLGWKTMVSIEPIGADSKKHNLPKG